MHCIYIQPLEYPIPHPAPPARAASQKPSSADISGTESGVIDPLVSKRKINKIQTNKKMNKKSKKKRDGPLDF